MRANGGFVASPKMRAYAQWMRLTLAQRRAITETTATRYQAASKRGKGLILDELCAITGWHRSHARKALKAALAPTVVIMGGPRPVRYGPEVIAALTVCWTVLGMPAGKRLAPMLTELVTVLRHFRELVISDETAALLVSMSAATIDRRLADERARCKIRGRVGTKPGSLLKSQIPVRTWAEWDDARPGFVEIDTVFHDGGNRGGGHAFTLTVTDIATGWTESRSLPDRTAKHILAALNHIAAALPFPILGVDSDNGSEFINDDLLHGAETAASPSPGHGRATRTTAATSSRRTGRWSAPWSATTATTPRQNCCYSTRSGNCSHS